MTILWGGSEQEMFRLENGSWAGTTSGTDTNFARAGIQLNGTTPDTVSAAYALGDVAECWAHCRWDRMDVNASGLNLFEIQNSAGQGVYRMRSVSSSTAQGQYWDGSTWQNIGSAFTVGSTTAATWDFHLLIDDTVGEFAAYLNGGIVSQLTGDTLHFMDAAIDKVIWGPWRTANHTLSECVLTDTVSTIGMRVSTLYATGNGDSTSWTGDYTAIDETAIDDNDFIASGSAGQVELFTLENLSVTAQGFDVLAIIAGCRARRGTTGPSQLDLAIRTNSNNYFSADLALTASFTNGYFNVWEVNPNTSNPWSVTEVNALEAGVRSIL